ncbi:MAG: LamG-like jellyroll fold domain-containing protein [Myxococcota bacterium]
MLRVLCGLGPLLLASCTLFTEFDYGFVAPEDAGPEASEPDATLDADAMTDADASIDATVDGDADVPNPCAPGYADLVMDYADNSGSPTFGRWRLTASAQDAMGTDYRTLEPDGDGFALLGTSLLPCESGACTAPLPNDSFEVRSNAGATGDATFELEIAADGVYSVAMPHRELDDASHRVLLSRSHRFDAIDAHGDLVDDVFTDRGYPPTSFLAGDRMLVTVPSDAAGSVGVRIQVDCAEGPGDCLLASDFEEAPLVTQCGGSSVMMDDPSRGPGPATVFGRSVLLLGESATYPESTNLDLSGDFTIQFWMRLEADPAGRALIVDNSDGTAGVQVALVGGVFTTEVPTDGGTLRHGTFAPPTMEWHFYRIVREGDTLRTCVDGVAAGTETDATILADLTSTAPVVFGSPELQIAADELRIYRGALPCEVN